MGEISKEVGKAGAESSALNISKLPLHESQYNLKSYPKRFIFLHHTAGGSAASSISWWAKDPKRIATPYVIDRDGTIYECFDPKYWASHLGSGVLSLEQQSIGIEIANYGALTVAAKDNPEKKYKKGDYISYTNKVIEPAKAVAVNFRGQKLWEAYTPQQIAALKKLLPYLISRFKIPLQSDRRNFWEYQNPAKLPPGIYSHSTVRKDKFDIFPQRELVETVYSL